MTDRKTTDFIVIHCSDTLPDMDIGAADIRKWHTDPPPKGRGWADIGYNIVIRRNGSVEKGRDVDRDGDTFEDIGAHVEGYNARALGVCMVGGRGSNGKPENNFTKAQFVALEVCVQALLGRYPKALVLGHRDFPNVTKACPCFDVRKWWADVHKVV